ncbi:hypothetical protein [Wolbachia endosymbiont of Oedothorax gibbosus]|uniref:hypothetical protein n=1 Tax=Wolbachia endosymbiont of Oedothorax gibbosus TaxID=931100 RepID=UPI0020253DC4|nr:hypothetical protein [Wolbachia endosymbiont of Oedothorax gibbosus]
MNNSLLQEWLFSETNCNCGAKLNNCDAIFNLLIFYAFFSENNGDSNLNNGDGAQQAAITV